MEQCVRHACRVKTEARQRDREEWSEVKRSECNGGEWRGRSANLIHFVRLVADAGHELLASRNAVRVGPAGARRRYRVLRDERQTRAHIGERCGRRAAGGPGAGARSWSAAARACGLGVSVGRWPARVEWHGQRLYIQPIAIAAGTLSAGAIAAADTAGAMGHVVHRSGAAGRVVAVLLWIVVGRRVVRVAVLTAGAHVLRALRWRALRPRLARVVHAIVLLLLLLLRALRLC